MSPLPDPAMADMPARSATAHNTGLNTGLNTPRQRAAWLLLALAALTVLLTALGASNGFDARPGGRICPQIIREAQDISADMGFQPG